MRLAWLILTPLAAAALAGLIGGRNRARWLAALACLAELGLAVWIILDPGPRPALPAAFVAELRWAWVPQIGASFHLAADGVSLLLAALTGLLGFCAVLGSWREVDRRVGFFHANILLVLAGIVGVFLAADLLLLFAAWELMLAPMYFLISLYGHENRRYAAMKFLMFTQAGSLLMLPAAAGLYFAHAQASGQYSFDYFELLGTPMSPALSAWLMASLALAFLVKLPAWPLHPWLGDAHTEAPTAGSVILAGLLLKTGAFGLLRFVLPMFPAAVAEWSWLGMMLGAVGVVYGAVLAFAQADVKRLVAYTSVSHMGFVLMGISARNELALQGVVLELVCHGLGTGGLFIVAGILQERLHTRQMGRMGGLWAAMPRLGGSSMVLALAALGLPGLGSFVAEFLILAGSWQAYPQWTIVAATGLVLSAVYALWMIQKTFHGPPRQDAPKLPDLNLREGLALGLMIAALFWIGVQPQPLMDLASPAVKALTGNSGATDTPSLRVRAGIPEAPAAERTDTANNNDTVSVDPRAATGETPVVHTAETAVLPGGGHE